jgi:hypothetical protein
MKIGTSTVGLETIVSIRQAHKNKADLTAHFFFAALISDRSLRHLGVDMEDRE